MIHCFVLLTSFLTAIPSDRWEGVANGPLRIGLLNVPHVQNLDSTRETAARRTSLRGLRGKYRRIRLDAPVAMASPESRERALDPLNSRRRSGLYEGIPRLDRGHVSPPSTGPPELALTFSPPPPQSLRKPP